MKLVIYLIFGLFTVSDIQTSNNGLAVIVNSENTTNVLSQSEVKLIYLRKITKRWSSIHKNIVPVDRKGMPEAKKVFLDKILGMSEDDLERYYAEREYQYAEMPPVEVASDAEVIEFVSKNIGAIGYVSASSVSAENNPNIKVIYP